MMNMLDVITLSVIGILQILKVFSMCEYMIMNCRLIFKTGYHLNRNWLQIQCYLLCNPCFCDIFVWAKNNCCCKMIERYCIIYFNFWGKNEIAFTETGLLFFKFILPCMDVVINFYIQLKGFKSLIDTIIDIIISLLTNPISHNYKLWLL